MFTKIFAILSLFVTRSYHLIRNNNMLYKSLQLYTIDIPTIDPDLDPEYWNHGEVPWDLDLENKTKTKPITITKSMTQTTINPFLVM